jgi:hypothetical protein
MQSMFTTGNQRLALSLQPDQARQMNNRTATSADMRHAGHERHNATRDGTQLQFPVVQQHTTQTLCAAKHIKKPTLSACPRKEYGKHTT